MPLVSKAFSEIITFTRASTGTYFDAAGTLTSAAINAPRFDYNPSTLAAQGFLVEEARTNSIRNNTATGSTAGVIGSGGVAPTNWFFAVQTTTGITRTIVGTGTESGISYVDLRLNGTATGAGTIQIGFELANSVAGLTSQSWTPSFYWKLAAGSLTGLTNPINALNEYTSAAVFVTFNSAAITLPTTAALATQRQATAITTNGGATTAFVQPFGQLTIANGAAIDITLRIGLPQLEQGAFATSVIPTTTTALTRAADVASVNTLSPWYNATEGTLYAESQLTRQNATAGLNTFYIWDTGTSEIKTFYRASGATGAAVISSGSLQADLTPTAVIPANTITKLALAYAANDFAASGNGGAAVTDTAGTVPSGLSQVILGGPSGILNGYLRRITYYPRRLSNAELQTLTT
jgi:hypothetical protein